MSNKKLFLPLIALLTLSGCGTSNETISYVDVVDLPTAIQYLSQIDNYTINVKRGEEIHFTSYVTPSYRYDESMGNGVLMKDSKVYPFTVKDNEVRNKAAIDNAPLFGNGGVGVNFDNIPFAMLEGYEFTTTKKLICIPMLDIAGYDSSAYIDLKDMTFKIEDKDVSKLTVNLRFHHFEPGVGEVITEDNLAISNIGSTKSDLIENFISNGQLYSIDPKLQLIADKLVSNNYTRIQPLENGHVGIVEMFNPLYYVRLASNEAIALDKKYLAAQETQLTILQPNKQLDCFVNMQNQPYPAMKYDDIYDFQYFGTYDTPGNLAMITRENPGRPGFAQGAYTEVMRDIAKVWDFPSTLKFIDYLEDVSLESKFGQFALTEKDLIDDFLKRFNLTGSFDQYGGVEEIDMTFKEDSNELNFIVVTKMGNYTMVFNDFGTTSFKPFDDLLKQINA